MSLRVYFAPGSSAADINAGIVEVAAAATPLQRGEVLLGSGDYDLSVPLDLLSYVDIRGEGRMRTRLRGTFTGGADTDTNALIRADGATSTAKINTVLSADVQAGATQITVANAGTIAANDWILIFGNNGGGQSYAGDLGNSDGINVVLREYAQVTNVAGNVLTLSKPLAQNHAGPVKAQVIGVTPVLEVGVRDLQLVGIASGSGQTAVGVLARYARDVYVSDVAGSAFSRSIVRVVGCQEADVRRVHNLGETNGIVHFETNIRSAIRECTSEEGVARVHPAGYPRAQIRVEYRCTDCDIVDNALTNGSVEGCIFYAGGLNNRFSRNRTANCQFDAAVYSRWLTAPEIGGATGAFYSLGFGSGHGNLNYAEFAFGTHVDDLVIDVSRCSGPTGVQAGVDWDALPAKVCGFYFHDTMRVVYSNISIINQGAVNNRITAARWSDVSGVLTNYLVRGAPYGVKTENVQVDVLVQNYRYDPVAGSAVCAGCAIYLDHSAASSNGPTFERIHSNSDFSGFFRVGPGFGYEARFAIHDIENDNGSWEYAVEAYNATATNFSAGDVVEIDPTYAGTELRVRTPDTADANYVQRLAVVVSALPSDPGTGWMLIAPLPQAKATIRCSSAAIVRGDRLIYDTANARQAKAGTAANVEALGTARTTKSAGAAGLVIAGPSL